MLRFGRRIATLSILLALAGLGSARAEDPEREVEPGGSRLPVPEGLPSYDIAARIDLERKRVDAVERVRFTNRTHVALPTVVLHVYPRYKVQDQAVLAKTLEFLRLSPEEALDTTGGRMSVSSVQAEGQAARHAFDPKDDTILEVTLAGAVAPGETIELEIAFELDLPAYWGRWGHHGGVTYLMNWYPVLAHVDDRGWERTPFVPWHQPWHQDAARYDVRLDLPIGQKVASTGTIVARAPAGEGRQVVSIHADPARDFALVCSDKFTAIERQVGATTIRVHSLPGNEANARTMLEAACEVVPLYEQWFGPYYTDEFEIAPAYFGWNGNECSGLVLIDERVMRLPSAGVRYLEHLVTHETCHQWFWNVVGTDGYAETFMDEGLVNCFTALRLDAKYGRGSPLIVWPDGLTWLPTIGREDLRLAGYYGWRARGNGGPVIQDMKAMGNLNALFSLAYDRGGKVVQMVYNRLGPERFFAFFGQVYRENAFKTYHYADLKRDLVAFDPGGGWDAFLDGWLIDHGETDWSVEAVSVGRPEAGRDERPVTVTLRQKQKMHEPTVLLCRCGDQDLRVPIWPERDRYDVQGARVVRSADGTSWEVTLNAPAWPDQVIVDPDHALLDAVPGNNRWRPEIAWRFTPLMTPLDESSQFQAYDRPSLVAGPFIDQYARGGFKVGLQRIDQYQITAWVGTEPALREAIFGGQIALLHTPWPRWTTGLFYEEGLYNFYNDQRHSGGRAFLRYRFLETTSFIVDDQGFLEFYFGTGNEFWPGDDGRPVDQWLDALGMRYRLSTLFPYWDPVQGRLVEVTAEYGNRAYGSAFDYTRVTAEYGFVRAIPSVFGGTSRSRLAFRLYGGFGYPDDQPLFRLGGGRRLRALDLTQDLGSAVWLTTLEWRYPLWPEIDRDVIDHVVGFRNLLGSVFYDVGQSYLRGQFNNVVHGVGVGLRLDVALFGFLERATLRVDLAQPLGLGAGRGPILWFGLNQVF